MMHTATLNREEFNMVWKPNRTLQPGLYWLTLLRERGRKKDGKRRERERKNWKAEKNIKRLFVITQELFETSIHDMELDFFFTVFSTLSDSSDGIENKTRRRNHYFSSIHHVWLARVTLPVLWDGIEWVDKLEICHGQHYFVIGVRYWIMHKRKPTETKEHIVASLQRLDFFFLRKKSEIISNYWRVNSSVTAHFAKHENLLINSCCDFSGKNVSNIPSFTVTLTQSLGNRSVVARTVSVAKL